MTRTSDRAVAGAGRQVTAILWLVAGVFGVYLATLLALEQLTGEIPTVAPTWPASAVQSVWLRPVVLLFGLSGVAIALLMPALAWALIFAGKNIRAASLFHRAFVLNLIQAIAFVSLWKAFAGEVPSRTLFISWQAAVAAAGLFVLFRQQPRRAARITDSWRPLAVGVIVILLLLPAFLWAKTFVEDGSGDGTESFEFSRSLATYQLPYWDLENGYYGFYPAFMLFAYPTQLAFIAIGEAEGAQRLPTFLYLLGIFLALAELIRRRRRPLKAAELTLLAGAAASFLLFHAYHSTYEIVSDLAQPTGVDVFFTFLITAALYAFIARQRVWFGVLAVLASMAEAAGLPFALLILGSSVICRPARHWLAAVRSVAVAAAAFVVPWIGYQLLVNVYARFHPLGATKWALGNVFTQYPIRVGWESFGTLTEHFAIAAAIVPLAGLALMARRDPITRTIGFPMLAYFATLVLFGRTNPHYVIPISLFPAAILLRGVSGTRVAHRARMLVYLVYALALVGVTLAVLPRDRSPHTAFRDVGVRTAMLYDSYPAVVEASTRLLRRKPELRVHLQEGKPSWSWRRSAFDDRNPQDGAMPWGLSHHLWIRYSDRVLHPGREYDQVLAAPHLAPGHLDGFSRRELEDGWVLLYRPERSIFTSLAPPEDGSSK